MLVLAPQTGCTAPCSAPHVPNVRRARYLPFAVGSLQLWHLQLVPSADPLTAERIAEAEGIKLEREHARILAQQPTTSQYDRFVERLVGEHKSDAR